jgi:hypothetical protein
MNNKLNAQTLAFTQLLSRLESLNRDDHRLTRDMLNERFCDRSARRRSRSDSSDTSDHFDSSNNEPGRLRLKYKEIVSDIEMLDVSDTAESKLRAFVGKKILQSLWYSSMTSRYEDVIEAHPKTFEWAFTDSKEEECSWSNISQWFQHGSGIYWISGKAGSGKSTLMKHIVDDRRTTDFLKVWARSVPLVVATFFFWNSGSKEQRTQSGLLRSLLFQILSKCPDLIPIVAPELWARTYSKYVSKGVALDNFEQRWTLSALRESFRALFSQKTCDLKICLLVDGLDEFEGDHDAISTLFNDIASLPNVKLCLSSRPWIVFEELFAECPKLRLQNLTYRDIKHYVSDKMRRNSSFRRLELEEPTEAPALIKEIVEKAKGVFVWVKLVVQSLLNGIRNQDDISDLWARLRLLPEEIRPLYSRLLDLIEPIYVTWTSKAFQIVRHVQDLSINPFRDGFLGNSGVKLLSAGSFWLAMNPDIDHGDLDDPSGQKYIRGLKRIQMQLTARCAGMLEISNSKSGDHVVQYFHRTVKDFLETSASSSKLLLGISNTDLRINVSLMRACIGSLRIIFAQRPGLSRGMEKKSIDAYSLVTDFMIYAYHAEVRRTRSKV